MLNESQNSTYMNFHGGWFQLSIHSIYSTHNKLNDFMVVDLMQMLKWDKIGVSNVAGEISLASGLVLWATTIPRIRRKFFEVFFFTHHLYILFMVFFIFHVGISFAFMVLPGFYLFLVDRYLRFLQSRQTVRLVSARILPCETVELNFSKAPGKFTFLVYLTSVVIAMAFVTCKICFILQGWVIIRRALCL